MHFILSLLAAAAITANAQVNPVYRLMEINRHNGSIHWADSLHGRDSIIAGHVSFMGYDDTAVVHLRRMGINFPFNFDGGIWNAKEKAAASDCIVIGMVTRIERTSQHRQFKIIAHIAADEFLRNDHHVSPSDIPVMIESDPEKETLWDKEQEMLTVGERVLLFLSAGALFDYAENNDTAYLKMLVNDPVIRFRILGYEGKYGIRGDSAYCRSGGDSLAVIRHQVAGMMAALSKSADTGEKKRQVPEGIRYRSQTYIDDSAHVFWTDYPNPFSPPKLNDNTKAIVQPSLFFYCDRADTVELELIDLKDSVVYRNRMWARNPSHFTVTFGVAGESVDPETVPVNRYKWDTDEKLRWRIVVNGQRKAVRIAPAPPLKGMYLWIQHY